MCNAVQANPFQCGAEIELHCIPHFNIQSKSEMRSILELTSQHDELIVHAASKAAQSQQSVHALQHICRMCLAVVGSVVVAVFHSPQELGKLAWLQLCASQILWSGVNPFCGQVSIHSVVRCQPILWSGANPFCCQVSIHSAVMQGFP